MQDAGEGSGQLSKSSADVHESTGAARMAVAEISFLPQLAVCDIFFLRMDKKRTSGTRGADPVVRASGTLKKAGAIMALAKRGQIDKAYACLEAVYIEYTRSKIDIPNDYILVHLALLGAEVTLEQRRA